jgi:putative endonuclease
MPAHCYIIFSQKLNHFYTDVCQEELAERIHKHNTHAFGKHRFTATDEDWTLFLDIPASYFAHAVRLWRFIKSKKSSIYIQNLKKYPELLEKIKNQTSN